MIAASRNGASLLDRAYCAVAGARDGMRLAQFYVRDLTNADGHRSGTQRKAPWLSRMVAHAARLTDRVMTRGTDSAITMLSPEWRKLPSPFTHGFMRAVANGIRDNSLSHAPLFNSYFFRSFIHIIERYHGTPYLVLEHRIDAARRELAARPNSPQPEVEFLAQALIVIAEHEPIARIGTDGGHLSAFGDVSPNIAVSAIACMALLFAEDGKPSERIDEDTFFELTGALLAPRLPIIASLVESHDEQGLAKELAYLESIY